MHEQNYIEHALIYDPIKLQYVSIYCLALIPFVPEPCVPDHTSYSPYIKALADLGKRP